MLPLRSIVDEYESIFLEEFELNWDMRQAARLQKNYVMTIFLYFSLCLYCYLFPGTHLMPLRVTYSC